MAFIQVRISEEEKKQAQEVFRRMGLSMSGGIKVFLKQVVSQGRLPFEVLETKWEMQPTSELKEVDGPEVNGQVQDLPLQENHLEKNSWGNFQKRAIG